MNSVAQCVTCRYRGDVLKIDAGCGEQVRVECRRHAPMTDSYMPRFWPKMALEEWCGDYEVNVNALPCLATLGAASDGKGVVTG